MTNVLQEVFECMLEEPTADDSQPSMVISRLGRALRRVFAHDCVRVAWSWHDLHGTRYERQWTLVEDGTPVHESGDDALPVPEFTDSDPGFFRESTSTPERPALALCLREARSNAKVDVLAFELRAPWCVEGEDFAGEGREKWLRALDEWNGWRHLFNLVRAAYFVGTGALLRRALRTLEQAIEAGQARPRTGQQLPDLSLQLRVLTAALNDPDVRALEYEPRVSRAASMAAWCALNLVFGTGRDDREVQVRPKTRAALGALVRLGSPGGTPLPWPFADRILGILSSVVGGERLPSPGDEALEPLDALDTWTRLHRRARDLGEAHPSSGPAQEATDWDAAAACALGLLATILSASGAPPANFDRFRNWLRLWLVHRVASHWCASGGRPRLDGSHWRLRADLAYVARECLRSEVHFEFGESWSSTQVALSPTRTATGTVTPFVFEYLYQPTTLSDAVRHLVEYHAVEVVRLPAELDVASLLEEIGHRRGAESYLLAAGHLQHVLDLYLFGHFLLSCRPPPTSESVQFEDCASSMASRSGQPPGTLATARLQQVFSLAVLFHDTGVLLFPRSFSPRASLQRGDPGLEEGLGSVARALADQGRALVARCRAEFEEVELFNLVESPALGRWLERQERTGRPDHALLGAWHLCRVCREMSDLPREVVREAVRAVLLHGAVTQVIDSRCDPAAALIVLGDEVFDWDPDARVGPERRAVGSSLHAMAVEIPPYRPRASSVKLRGLHVSAPAGVLRCDLATGDPWPTLELVLHSPEFLEQRVWQTWLTLCQNLQRVQPAKTGFSPVLFLDNAVPSRIRHLGGTRRLLESTIWRTRVPVRGHLEHWLNGIEAPSPQLPDGADDTADRDPASMGPGFERLIVRAQGQILAAQDVRAFMAQLDADAEAVTRDEMRRTTRTFARDG